MRSTSLHVEQLVLHAQARLLGVVVEAVHRARNVKPLPRRNSSTSRIASGSTCSAALSRKNSVSRTLPSSSRAPRGQQLEARRVRHRRVLPARDVDARPAVGVRDELLGADGVVALAPAHRRVLLDHRAQLQDAVHQRLGPGRAAGHVDVDRHELVGRHDRVVVEDAHRRRAGAHRDRVLRLEHLVVDAPHDRGHLDRDAARQDEQVGLAGGGAEGLEAEARDVDARGDDRHHLDRAAGQAEGGGEHRVARAPTRRPCRASW